MMSRIDWFTEARFGMFVHWGPYAVGGRGEWVMNRERIPKNEYREFCLAELKNRVVAAWFLDGGQAVDFQQEGARLWLRNLPTPLPCSPVTTIVLEVEGSPEPFTETTTFWIPN